MRLVVFCLAMLSFLTNAQDTNKEQVIAPGNKVYLHIPGESEFEEPFEVDDKGYITLPELGQVKLAGKAPERAEAELKLKLAGIYKAISGFYLEVRSRDIVIDVLGYVKKPSRISLTEQGNVQTVIAEAGGIRPGAQLNKIQLRRGDDVTVFDYKYYLDTGDVSQLPQLQSGDTLFVPVSPLLGNVQMDFDAETLSSSGDAIGKEDAVTLFGELHSPGSFSYKSGMSIIDALMRAEGVTRYADVTKIRVIRDGSPTLFDLKQYLDSGDPSMLPAISKDTTIYVPIMVDDVNTTARTVYIMGEVQNPGAYESNEKGTFLDILANAGGPTRFAETREIKILRPDGDNVLFDLYAYSNGLGENDIPSIAPGDVIFIPEKTDQNEKSWLKMAPTKAVKIMGAVNTPGRYAWSDEMDFTDLFAHAGGPTQSANVNNIKVIRDGKLQRLFSLDEYASDNSDHTLPEIKAGDTIIVEELRNEIRDRRSQWVMQDAENSIYIMGQVGSPGRYAFQKKYHFLDILAAADGPTVMADIQNIRITHRNGREARVSQLDLALYFETGDETLFPRILPGDTIFIPEKSKNWLRQPKNRVVRIMGAIAEPGRYTFDDTMTLLDLLAEAGGPTPDALIEKIVVINHGCCSDQSRRFNLEKFIKRPDARNVPILRAGDTVYIPNHKQSFTTRVKDSLLETLTILALAASL